MTTIQKDEYVFSVDVPKTREYYKMHSLCDCECCQNYYAQAEEKLPKLAAFLNEFGVDISKPDEIFSVEIENHIDYINVDYTVCGNIKSMGDRDIDVYDNLPLKIVITDGLSSPNEQEGEYFTISVTQIKLPWVINKPFPETMRVKAVKKLRKFFGKPKA